MSHLEEERQPAWVRRSVDRSLRGARVRAGNRANRFLDAAQAAITEKGSTDITVQEVVDRAGQSLTSFYMRFDGKHELLLALYEDTLDRTVAQIRAATGNRTDPLDKLRIAVELLYQLCRPDPRTQRPLFTEFAPQLLRSRAAEVRKAHASHFELFTELLTEAERAGALPPGANPRRLAAITMQAVMYIARPTAADDDADPITAADVWAFCSRGITRPRD
ncbi:TetR/AcrR family transcriptional regulator [Nocardia sp. NPDC003482]|uniref:TetR/AcrR family transcriptional regulator n=1 Tax=Nocardia sp. NPDC004068 TaxID=3364303 RepID=UPI0036BF3858